MHPHHVHISCASPRVKSRGASSEEKKEEVREKDNEQHRTAYHQLGDDGKEALAEKKADYRTGYSEPKKQDVRQKDAEQHRGAFTTLCAFWSFFEIHEDGEVWRTAEVILPFFRKWRLVRIC